MQYYLGEKINWDLNAATQIENKIELRDWMGLFVNKIVKGDLNQIIKGELNRVGKGKQKETSNGNNDAHVSEMMPRRTDCDLEIMLAVFI